MESCFFLYSWYYYSQYWNYLFFFSKIKTNNEVITNTDFVISIINGLVNELSIERKKLSFQEREKIHEKIRL